MKQITDEDGHVYVLKTDMENLIKDRISKVAMKAREYETLLNEANDKITTLSKDTANVDILTGKIQDLETKLSKSSNQFDRYKAISKHGLVDDDIIEAIEWAYERTMNKTDNKDRVDLGKWLQSQIDDIDNSHPLLKPHLHKAPADNQDLTPSNDLTDTLQSKEQTTPKTVEIPRVNTGAKKPPESRNIIDQGLNDPKFYEQNREAILDAYKKLYRGK